MLEILDWIERCDKHPITADMMKAMEDYLMFHKELSAVRLSGALWGFLNTCLKGEAHTVFEGADALRGFGGWRLVIHEIQRGRPIRMVSLRQQVKHPPKIHKLEDVAGAMLRYQHLLKEYKAVDGILPSEHEQTSDLLDSLPQELRENLLWRATNFPNEKLSDFQAHIRATVNEILFHRGKVPIPVNAINATNSEDIQHDHIEQAKDRV